MVHTSATQNLTTIFWDIGGILLSNAWRREARAEAVTRFDLAPADFEMRHQRVALDFECGRLSMDDYLTAVAKPDEAIFQKALYITHRRPDECLFIDDRPPNVEAARRAGMTAIHFTGQEALMHALADAGVTGVNR